MFMKSALHLTPVLALLAWPCAAQETSANAIKSAGDGKITAHSQGLHGYIGYGHE
jgi:hypothetical protein